MSRETVSEKARRLVSDGKVTLENITEKYANAEVEGDHNRYTVMVWFDEFGNIRKANCGCKWNILHRKNVKWCSHIRSVLLAIREEKEANRERLPRMRSFNHY